MKPNLPNYDAWKLNPHFGQRYAGECEECQIDVYGDGDRCPQCGGPLRKRGRQ